MTNALFEIECIIILIQGCAIFGSTDENLKVICAIQILNADGG